MTDRQLKYCATLGLGIGLYLIYRQQSKKKRLVGTLAALEIFPMKSAAGIPVNSADASEVGLTSGQIIDRFFCARFEKNNDKVTYMQLPKLLLIKVQPGESADIFIFKAENQDDFQLDVSKLTVKTKVTIFDSTVDSFDGGDELADWLSNFTGARVRLSYNPTNRDVVEANPGFENYWRLGAIGDFKRSVNFGNRFSYHFLGLDSIADLNRRLPDGVAVTYRNFRPNVIVKALSNKPWAEEDWLGRIYIGDAIFALAGKKARCPMVNFDPATGKRNANDEPLKTLKTYRLPSAYDEAVIEPRCKGKAEVGMDMLLLQAGRMNVGDKIFLVPN